MRTSSGAQIVEFAAAFALIMLLFLPIINLAGIPLQMAFIQWNMTSSVRKLASEEKFSDAIHRAAFDDQVFIGRPSWLMNTVEVKAKVLQLCIARTENMTEEILVVEHPRAIPSEWLPGNSAVCDYALHLKLQAQVRPFVTFPLAGKSIAGLNAPVNLNFESVSHWENLGRDPNTGEFYLNE